MPLYNNHSLHRLFVVMSKLSFRARALDANRTMEIIRYVFPRCTIYFYSFVITSPLSRPFARTLPKISGSWHVVATVPPNTTRHAKSRRYQMYFKKKPVAFHISLILFNILSQCFFFINSFFWGFGAWLFHSISGSRLHLERSSGKTQSFGAIPRQAEMGRD